MKKIDRKTWILAIVMFVVIVLLTWLISIDMPATTKIENGVEVKTSAGYWTLGDAGVLVAAVLLGGPLGALVSGLGSMFGDLLAGYPSYMLATLIIKGAMAFFVAWYYKRGTSLAHRIKTFGIAGAWMVAAYFLYDTLIRGDYIRAAIGLPFNILQAIACGLLAILVLILTGGKSYRQEEPVSGMPSGRNLK